MKRQWRMTHSAAMEGVRRFQDIPGPSRVPLFGSLFHYKLGRYKVEDYHKVIAELYEQFGPVVREDFGPKNSVIHVYDPDDAKQVYTHEGRTPHVVPLQETTQFYRKERNLSPGLGNTNGEEWYRLRNAVRQMMLRPKEVQYYLPKINEVSQVFVNRLERKRDQRTGIVPNLRNEVAKWSRESSGWVCFETRLGSMDEGEKEARQQVLLDANKAIFKMSAGIKFSLPLHKVIKTLKWKKLLEKEDLFNLANLNLVREAVEKIKLLESAGQLKGKFSFLSYLLSRQDLSDKDVEILTLSMLTDGLSTTVPSLIYNLYCLAVNPEVQEAVHGEVSSVLGNQTLTAELLNRLPLLKAVVKETFRLYPIGTEISRITNTDLILSGYQVPAGTHVNLNQSVHYSSERYFAEPGRFNPERWLRDSEGPQIHPYLLVPFGHGTRTCAGRRFAEQDLYVTLSNILKRFRLEYAANAPQLEQVYEILLFPKEPVQIRFIPRD